MKYQTENGHDGCKDCRHESKGGNAFPCNVCKQNYVDKYEKKTTNQKKVEALKSMWLKLDIDGKLRTPLTGYEMAVLHTVIEDLEET